MNTEKAERLTSVASNVKTFLCLKGERVAFLALILNHTGDTKYCEILKKCMNLLQNIKWNRRSYPLGKHVSDHHQAFQYI